MCGRWLGITSPLHRPVYCLAVLYSGVKRRGLVLRCVTDHLCWCLTGVSHPHLHHSVSRGAVAQTSGLCAFTCPKSWFSSWVVPSCTRIASERYLLQLWCVQSGCLPALAAPCPLKVKCSEAEATLKVFCNCS